MPLISSEVRVMLVDCSLFIGQEIGPQIGFRHALERRWAYSSIITSGRQYDEYLSGLWYWRHLSRDTTQLSIVKIIRISPMDSSMVTTAGRNMHSLQSEDNMNRS